MRCKLLFISLLILALPLISATTTINLKTLPYHTAYITIVEPQEEYQQIELLKSAANFQGKLTVTYEEGGKSKVGVLVVVKDGNAQTVLKERMDDYNTGGTIDLELLPDGYVDPFPDEAETKEEVKEEITEEITTEDPNGITETNEITEEKKEEEKVIEETEKTDPTVTGNAVLDIKDSLKSKTAYIISGLLVLSGIVFFIFKRHSNSAPEMPKNMNFDKGKPASRIDALEKRLASLDAEIEEVQKGKQLSSIERKIEEKERILQKLRGN